MTISAITSGSLLPFSAASTAASSQKTQSSQKNAASTSQTDSNTASDSYTPSQWPDGIIYIKDSTGSGYTVTESGVAGISQSTLTAMATAMEKIAGSAQDPWLQLGQSLNTGNISSAQTALNSYNQSYVTANESMSALTTPTAQFTNAMSTLSSALSAGSLADARSAYQTADQNKPDLSGAVSNAMAAAAGSGEQAVQTMENNLSTEGAATISGGTAGKLSNDMANLVNTYSEAVADGADYLVTQGFSSSDANAFVSANLKAGFIESSGSWASSAKEGASVSAQWIAELSRYAKESTSPTSSQASTPELESMYQILNSALSTVSFATAQQTQSLVEDTLGTSSSSSSVGSISANDSTSSTSNAGVNAYA